MTVLACFLRAINVGGNRLIKMADLRALIESHGFTDVKTLLQSGNVVFSSTSTASAASKVLTLAIEKQFGFHVDLVIKTAAELRAAVAENPFEGKPGYVVVLLTQTRPSAAGVKTLQQTYKGPEEVLLVGSNLYVNYGDTMGRSKLTGTLLDKATATPGTARTLNTINKTIALM